MRRPWRARCGFGVVLGLCCAHAWALDAVSASWADSMDNGVRMVRVTLHWDLQRAWFEREGWYVAGGWELSAGYWDEPREEITEAYDVGVSLALRLQARDPASLSSYLELGGGPHVLSDRRAADREFSTDLQFGTFLGAGLRLGGPRGALLGYRALHFSNAGIRRPNVGINFHMLRLELSF